MFLKKIPLIIYIIIISFILMKFFNNKKEKFEIKEEEIINNEEKPKRFMYQTSGIKKNSSYDIRAEETYIKYEPELTGNKFHGDLENNLTNDRIKQ